MLRVVSVDEAQETLADVIREDYERSLSRELGLVLSPNWDAYRILEQYNALHIAVAEHDEKVVGYVVVTFFRSNHYDALCASVDALWLLEEFRAKSTLGVSLIKEVEKESKSRNVELINFHSQDFNNLSRILDRLGYSQTDVVMSKKVSYGH